MRLDDGMKFDHCVGLQDRGAVDGRVFNGDTLHCHDKPLNAGDSILVAGRPYQYLGDDNLGNSHFQPLAPFPKFELVERPYKDNLYVVIEVYRTANEKPFYIWPYVQHGETASNNYGREHFPFSGHFATREEGIEAAWEAGKKRIEEFYLDTL